jgi:hypothetical protein
MMNADRESRKICNPMAHNKKTVSEYEGIFKA